MEKLKEAQPASITVVTLLKKNCPREVVVEPDYHALEVRRRVVCGVCVRVWCVRRLCEGV